MDARRRGVVGGTPDTASVAANELARAIGTRDLLILFALTSGLRAKVEFCWRLVHVDSL